MKKALIRLEDVGPGGLYGSEESLWKLRVIADYLHSEGVPFHISMISRFVHPATGYDKSIADTTDPFVQSFIATMRDLQKRGASLGMHGYRHQYGQSVTGDGYEFTHDDSAFDSPPDDTGEACLDRTALDCSYTSQRIRDGLHAIQQSGLQVDWFSTPHYTASANQRNILETWMGLFFENKPDEASSNLIISDVDSPLYRGVIYVPTPLFYVEGSQADEEVTRILEEIKSYTQDDIAAFFFHPYLDFPFIHQADSTVIYEEQSYLKRLIRNFKQQQFRFVPLLSLVPFVPSFRQTNFFPGTEFQFFTADVDGDKQDELLIWHPSRGDWYVAKGNLENYPSRQHQPFAVHVSLSKWKPFGEHTSIPLIGDFNGDGQDDIALWNPQNAKLQFALSDGTQIHPHPPFAKSELGSVPDGSDWIPFVGDFNGDGRDEIVWWRPSTGEWQVTGRIWLSHWAAGSEWVPCVGDFDGDGRDELIAWHRTTGAWQAVRSTGSEFTPAQGHVVVRLWEGLTGEGWQLFAGDFNGDGRSDLLLVNPTLGDWRVALSTGSELIPFEQALMPWAAGAYTQPLVGTFSRDGRASLCARHPFLRGGVIDFAVSVLGIGTIKK